MRTLVAMSLALALAGVGCKKENVTAAQVSPPAKVEPAQIQAVVAAIDKGKATDVELQKKDVVAQPVKLLDQLKNVGAVWTAAMLLVPELKKYDAWVQQVLVAVTEVENLRLSIAEGNNKLVSIQTALDNVAKGSPKTTAELQGEVSAQVTQIVSSIDAATLKAQAQLQPVVEVMSSLGVLATGLCAVPLPEEAAGKRAPVCADVGSAIGQAQDFLNMVLRLPIRSEIAALLSSSLAPYLDEPTKKLLATPPAPPTPLPAPTPATR
jgi:hypothetical protein